MVHCSITPRCRADAHGALKILAAQCAATGGRSRKKPRRHDAASFLCFRLFHGAGMPTSHA